MATANANVKKVLDSLKSKGTIVEEWHDGSEWYRIWSNGFMEQSGRYTSGTANVGFYKPFSDVDYAFVTSGGSGSLKFSTTGIVFDTSYGVDVKASGCWYACGY